MEESHHKEDSSQKRSRIIYLLKDNLLHANSKSHYTSCSSIFSLNVRRILCRSLRSAIHMTNMEIWKCVKWSRVRGVKNMGTINLQPKNCSLSLIEKSNAVVLGCWSIVSFTGQIQHAPLPDCSPKFKPPVFFKLECPCPFHETGWLPDVWDVELHFTGELLRYRPPSLSVSNHLAGVHQTESKMTTH